jgi:imidazole glycerol-phosphate synthase subunit HisH
MIAIIDYGAGNVASVANALTELKQDFLITNNENEILKSEKIIFPGQGEASYAVKQLHKLNLYTLLRICKKPFLGICLGMQLMAAHSAEGNVGGLGIFPGGTEKFDSSAVKVPHIGWNDIRIQKESILFNGISGGKFYFAHSFFLPLNEYTTSVTSHKTDFSASMERNNFYGVQFHPEKSGELGMKLLQNFILL